MKSGPVRRPVPFERVAGMPLAGHDRRGHSKINGDSNGVNHGPTDQPSIESDVVAKLSEERL